MNLEYIDEFSAPLISLASNKQRTVIILLQVVSAAWSYLQVMVKEHASLRQCIPLSQYKIYNSVEFYMQDIYKT